MKRVHGFSPFLISLFVLAGILSTIIGCPLDQTIRPVEPPPELPPVEDFGRNNG